jgi:hypothetical protein
MSPAEMIARLDALHAAGKFFGLSIWPAKGGYQVNLATSSKNNWRVRRAETPSEGLALVLGMDFMDDDGLSRSPAALLGEPEMLAPPAVDEPPLEDYPEDSPNGTGIFD